MGLKGYNSERHVTSLCHELLFKSIKIESLKICTFYFKICNIMAPRTYFRRDKKSTI